MFRRTAMAGWGDLSYCTHPWEENAHGRATWGGGRWGFRPRSLRLSAYGVVCVKNDVFRVRD